MKFKIGDEVIVVQHDISGQIGLTGVIIELESLNGMLSVQLNKRTRYHGYLSLAYYPNEIELIDKAKNIQTIKEFLEIND